MKSLLLILLAIGAALSAHARANPTLSCTVIHGDQTGSTVETKLDGTYNDLNDWQGFSAECEQSRELGMDGKTLVHPRQVPIANEVFAPTADEVAWAEKIISAFARPENANKAVIAVDGQMVERLHERMAERVIETATAILPPEA